MTALLTRRTGILAAKPPVVPGSSAIASNTFEGVASGTALTSGNSGGVSGTAFDAVSTSGVNTPPTVDSTHAAHGSRGMEVLTGATAGSSYVQWDLAVGTQTLIYCRMDLYFTAFPAASSTLWRALSGGTTATSLQTTSAGILRLQNTAGNVNTSLPNALPLNQWFRLEWSVSFSTTVGAFDIRRYDNVDSTTVSASITNSNQVLTANADTYRFGLMTATANWGPTWYDDLAIGNTGFLGPS